MTETSSAAWCRLAAAVKARRDYLRLTQTDVASRGGPSLPTIQSIEAARTDRYKSRTLHDLEDALGWTRGSVDLVLEGKEPGLLVTQGDEASSVIAAVLADPHLLPEAKQHLVNQYGLLLRVQGSAPLTVEEKSFVDQGQTDLDATGLRLVDTDPTCR